MFWIIGRLSSEVADFMAPAAPVEFAMYVLLGPNMIPDSGIMNGGTYVARPTDAVRSHGW
jgi:hypothetical protein